MSTNAMQEVYSAIVHYSFSQLTKPKVAGTFEQKGTLCRQWKAPYALLSFSGEAIEYLT